MRLSWLLGSLLLSQSLIANEKNPYSRDSLETFFDVFVYEQHEILQGRDPFHPPIPPPPPPVNPLPPAPMNNMLPVVITNNTGLPADQVYVTLAGQQIAGETQYFFQLDATTGIYTPVEATENTYSPNYSYLLSGFPNSTTGANDYLAYAPALVGARFYFSIQKPMYLQSDTPNSITAPAYYPFYDPNYNNLFESLEATFITTPPFPIPSGAITWTASVNTTEVDAFCLPIRISYFSYDPSNPSAVTPMVQDPNALPSGFGVGGLTGSTTRNTILTSLFNGLTSGDLTDVTPKVWPRLAIPFYSDPYAGTGLQTYLRVLSPKQSIGNDPTPLNTGGLTSQHIGAVDGSEITTFKNYNYPPFPLDYFTGSYGAPISYANSLFSYYTDGTKLYLSTGGGTPTVYEGVTTGATGSYMLTFTGQTGPNTGQISTIQEAAEYPDSINTYKMFSGSQHMEGGLDGVNLGLYFGDAFTVGMLPSSVGTASGTPINITDATPDGWEDTNVSNYYVAPNSSLSGGPWYSLYAKELHKIAVRNTSSTFLNNYGLCYGYDFDDSLGISGTITPKDTTPNILNPYLGITLGSIDTAIPDPYSDATSYSVTFIFDAEGGRTLSYQQGSGPIIPVTSGSSIPGLYSNSTNPLRLFYSNLQGPTGSHEFIIYLKYQFLVPIGTYNSSEVSIINSTSITPDDSPPTSFTVTLLP